MLIIDFDRSSRQISSKNVDDRIDRSDFIKHQQRLIRDEERDIKRYEKLLRLRHYTKRNKLPKSFYLDDIYGFIRDQEGNIIKPQDDDERREQRKKLLTEIVVDENLQRKLRGFLNRLTDSNLKGISKQIIDLNANYSRPMINKGIMNCIDNIIINNEEKISSKLLAEIALLITVLYQEENEEIGGFFLHSIISRFDEVFQNHSDWSQTKKLDNVVGLILNLYVTGLIESSLIYEIIDKFIDKFDHDQKSIEMIDLILKNCGFLLRKDDPSKMCLLIKAIQKRKDSIENVSGSKIRFILENLTLIKNNNSSKFSQQNSSIVLENLIANTLRSIIKKNRVQCLAGRYSAILKTPHWYSYTGELEPSETSIINDRTTGKTKIQDNQLVDTMIVLETQQTDLDRLCHRLRINAPLRKELLKALIVSNNYVEAAGKMISIAKKQSSEIINVILYAAINESKHNRFYDHLLVHFSNIDRKYKVALNFAIRDKLKDLNRLSSNNRSILQSLMVTLMKQKCLPITCLKVIEFIEMDEIGMDFIRNILHSIFQEDNETIEAILSRIPKKDEFATAMKLFIHCFMESKFQERISNLKQIQMKLKS
ncbi:nucleolar MIF4G domain-containing protein 1-like protein [Sarcoptes scabiei]|uniref:Nucleolar MIF4G domain-containing protein 1-like protein n=1 Tax=Sarcoptes scabiei TaxID=52283 RepID=A0A132A4P1_SARSC|nr:nucleolar MIF4G domain-containing protein 1-like protein [Sarcoptes scabiei]